MMPRYSAHSMTFCSSSSILNLQFFDCHANLTKHRLRLCYVIRPLIRKLPAVDDAGDACLYDDGSALSAWVVGDVEGAAGQVALREQHRVQFRVDGAPQLGGAVYVWVICR